MRDFNSTNNLGHFPLLDRSRQPEAEPFTLQERLYTPQKVADRLGVSERWVHDHATWRNPRIGVLKLSPLLRFRETDIAPFE